MNALDSYRFDYAELSLFEFHPRPVFGRDRGLAVLPDAVCTFTAGDRFYSEHVWIGETRWIRLHGRDWAVVEDVMPAPQVQFANAQGGLVEGATLPGGLISGTLPTNVRLAGRESVNGRAAWAIKFEYSRTGIEGPFDEFATVWIDQETNHILKKELIRSDFFGSSNTVRRWLYRDFDSGASIQPPEPGYVASSRGSLPLPGATPRPKGTPLGFPVGPTPTPSC